jgi:3-oxoacyl-[acyl-carrier protein] reductase
MLSFDFDRRVAMITGGGRGIGAATSDILRSAGASVVVFDMGQGPADAELTISGDVTNSSELDAAVAHVIKEFGRLDILICAAGIAGESRRSFEVPDHEWESLLAVNAHGTFYANRAAAIPMMKAGYGRIVNISSIAGKEGNPMDVAYSASKAAVISLTKSFGKDLAGSGVLVNCVTPGPTETAMTASMEPDRFEYVVSRVPLGRMAHPEEVATTIAFLASDACTFATGAVYDLSGGRAVY